MSEVIHGTLCLDGDVNIDEEKSLYLITHPRMVPASLLLLLHDNLPGLCDVSDNQDVLQQTIRGYLPDKLCFKFVLTTRSKIRIVHILLKIDFPNIQVDHHWVQTANLLAYLYQ